MSYRSKQDQFSGSTRNPKKGACPVASAIMSLAPHRHQAAAALGTESRAIPLDPTDLCVNEGINAYNKKEHESYASPANLCAQQGQAERGGSPTPPPPTHPWRSPCRCRRSQTPSFCPNRASDRAISRYPRRYRRLRLLSGSGAPRWGRARCGRPRAD